MARNSNRPADPAPTVGLGPDFLETNIPAPTPGRFAPIPAQLPGQSSPDPLPPGSTMTVADVGDQGDDVDQEPTRRPTIRIPTPVKDIRSGPFETVARSLLRALGGLVNSRIQVDDDDASFISDEEDEKMFAPAAGRVAARHMPLPDKADMSELEDIGVAAVALMNWLGKGLIQAWDARAGKRRARAVLKGTGAAVYTGGPGEMEDQTA